ncbi:MAG TPA: WYL domain-containing protein [Longimicrobiales bacterium]|nr:WYL domain-containing protein [Longimicrobiales bacterium]
MPTKLQRWLDLIAFLVGRRLPVAYDELMSGVPAYAREYDPDDETARASLRRKFERDKKELRALGIPIRTVRYSINYGIDEIEGYQIDRRDFYLPYLELVSQAGPAGGSAPRRGRVGDQTVELVAEDAPLALDGLRRVVHVPGFPLASEARSAFRKLAFDIDPDAFRTDAPVLFIDPPGTAELSTRLRALSDALLARKRVRFPYHGLYRDAVTQREVAPYGLLFQHGHWYMIGLDSLRDAVRVFRVGRMGDVTANPEHPAKPDYEIPVDFSLDEYADREAWELGDPEEPPVVARVRFHFPLSLWAERNDRGALVEQRRDGSQVREFEIHQVSPFLRWLLSLEGEAEILDPPALQHELRQLARAVADQHTPRSS